MKRILMKLLACGGLCGIVATCFDAMSPLVLNQMAILQLENDSVAYLAPIILTHWQKARTGLLLAILIPYAISICKDVNKLDKSNKEKTEYNKNKENNV